MGHYSQDAALMASYGYRAVNVEQYNETRGLLLTLLLIFGLLLTPLCIGVVILCFLPFAFTKRYNVSYVFQPPSVLPLPQPLPTQPFLPPSYSRPLAPLPYSQPPSQPYQSVMPTAQGYAAAPPEQRVQDASLSTRFSEGIAYLRHVWKNWTPVERGLAVLGVVVVGSVAIASVAFVVVVLVSGGMPSL